MRSLIRTDARMAGCTATVLCRGLRWRARTFRALRPWGLLTRRRTERNIRRPNSRPCYWVPFTASTTASPARRTGSWVLLPIWPSIRIKWAEAVSTPWNCCLPSRGLPPSMWGPESRWPWTSRVISGATGAGLRWLPRRSYRRATWGSPLRRRSSTVRRSLSTVPNRELPCFG